MLFGTFRGAAFRRRSFRGVSTFFDVINIRRYVVNVVGRKIVAPFVPTREGKVVFSGDFSRESASNTLIDVGRSFILRFL